jgi:hypothetical protein
MISDTLFDGAREIRRYLTDPTFAACYENDLRPEIVALLNQMDRLRTALDGFPSAKEGLVWLKSGARDARSVPPQADSVVGTCADIGPWPQIPHNWSVPTIAFSGTPYAATTRHCHMCGLHETTQTESAKKRLANHATEPLVKPERVTAIKAFSRSLELLCDCYGVKLKPDTDYSGDLLILDQTRTIPSGYYFDARITPSGELEIAEWVLDEEAGATNQ